MDPLSVALALACLLAPEVQLDAPPTPLSAFQCAAVGMELLDPRECRCIFADTADFRADLRRIQERAQELAGAPPLCDQQRFPASDQCALLLCQNSEYASWLEQRQRLFPRDEWIADALAECASLRRPWQLAADIGKECYSVQHRRACLQELRELIGPQLYYAGCLPAHVPVWRMRRID